MMSDSPITQQTYPPLSVVIPTLGGESLFGTIEQLNRGTIVPAEILVCIPQKESSRVKNLSFNNVKIVQTECRGQVAQRAIGFQQACHSLVMQLDDDILVREKCLENLAECIMGFTDVAVGPKIYNIKTHKYVSYLVPVALSQRSFEKLLYWVINGSQGYKPGQIGRAGINMGIPEEPADWYDLGWLPGGCILHHRKNLILYDFYPFKGKAYGEDLFHSVLLRKKGVRLMRCGAATCDLDVSSSHAVDKISFIKSYLGSARTLTRFVTEIDGSLLRLYLFLILNLVRHVTRKMHVLKSNKKSDNTKNV